MEIIWLIHMAECSRMATKVGNHNIIKKTFKRQSTVNQVTIEWHSNDCQWMAVEAIIGKQLNGNPMAIKNWLFNCHSKSKLDATEWQPTVNRVTIEWHSNDRQWMEVERMSREILMTFEEQMSDNRMTIDCQFIGNQMIIR